MRSCITMAAVASLLLAAGGPNPVLDMSTDVGGLSFGVVAPGAGTLGVDDASLEVVDPARVPATERATVQPLDPVKRARELRSPSPARLTGRRTSTSNGKRPGWRGRARDGRPDRVPYQRAQACRRTESDATPGSGMARHGTA